MSGWWYIADGNRKGPVTDDELYRLLLSGTIRANSLIWREGMGNWQPAFQVQSVAPWLASVPPEIPPTEIKPQPSTAAGRIDRPAEPPPPYGVKKALNRIFAVAVLIVLAWAASGVYWGIANNPAKQSKASNPTPASKLTPGETISRRRGA